MKSYEQSKCLWETAREFEWDKWCVEIPYLNFPSDWMVRAVPPFSTGIIRYHIKNAQGGFVSVYLDCYDMAGCMRKPYWEIHPYDGDCKRFCMQDTNELLQGIAESLEQQKDTN